MTSEDRGYGPDNMGDDGQETEVSEWERYIEDPPEGELEVREDDDADAEENYDWAERHPRDTGHDGDVDAAQDNVPAERSAVRERRNPLRARRRAVRVTRRRYLRPPHPPRRPGSPVPAR